MNCQYQTGIIFLLKNIGNKNSGNKGIVGRQEREWMEKKKRDILEKILSDIGIIYEG